MSLESDGGMIYWQGKTEEPGEKPVPVPLCPPQITHWLTRARIRASAVRGRRITTTWAMARPNKLLLLRDQPRVVSEIKLVTYGRGSDNMFFLQGHHTSTGGDMLVRSNGGMLISRGNPKKVGKTFFRSISLTMDLTWNTPVFRNEKPASSRL
jgi:hypothetical protein